MSNLKCFFSSKSLMFFLFFCGVSLTTFSQSNSSFTVSGSMGTNAVAAEATITYRLIPFDGKMFLAYDSRVKLLTELGYAYKGKTYNKGEVPELDVLLSKLKGSSPKVTLKVYYRSISRGEFNQSIDGPLSGLLGDGIEIGMVSSAEASDLANWRVEGISLSSYLPSNIGDWLAVDRFLDNYEFKKKRTKDFDALLESARVLMVRKDYLKAQLAYEKALEFEIRQAFVKEQLKLATAGVAQQDKKRQHENLMALAAEQASKKNFSSAMGMYQAAVNVGYATSEAVAKVGEMSRELQRAKEFEEEEIRKASLINDEMQLNKGQDIQSKQAEQLKQLETIRSQNQKKELDKLNADSRTKIANELEAIRIKEQDEERQKEEQRLAKTRQERAERASDLTNEIAKAEAYMEYDPEQLKISLKNAKDLEAQANAIRPSSALERRPEWYDLSGYLDDFRDELYEPKRREASEKYYQLLFDEWQALEKAQNAYFEAMSYAQQGSGMHKYIVSKIQLLGKLYESTFTLMGTWASGEESRRKARAANKRFLQMQRMNLNEEKAKLAFQSITIAAYRSGDPTKIAEAQQQQRELENRLYAAQEASKAVKLVEGAMTGGAVSIIASNKVAKVYGHNSIGLNARVGVGLFSIPITTNWESKGYISRSDVQSLILVSGLGEVDFWMLRNKYLDLGITGGAVVGINPSEGYTGTYFLQYHATGKINVGVKLIKLALEGNFTKREAVYLNDLDVSKASSNIERVPGDPTGVIVDGKFKYGLHKLGAGVHIDFTDDYTERYLRLLVHAERPSFLKNSFTKDPLISFSFELLPGTRFNSCFPALILMLDETTNRPFISNTSMVAFSMASGHSRNIF
ncbi:MAG: hypothetical protein EOP48_03015 [Sphingobacteriales bacterium]|nr:MAG: hypothetical protein EOP48_03015 [Sphingobacteriales bacterium]